MRAFLLWPKKPVLEDSPISFLRAGAAVAASMMESKPSGSWRLALGDDGSGDSQGEWQDHQPRSLLAVQGFGRVDESGEIAALHPAGTHVLSAPLADQLDREVVISHHAFTTEFPDPVHAFCWKCALADDAAEKHDPPGSALIHITEHRFKGRKIGMNVGEDGDLLHRIGDLLFSENHRIFLLRQGPRSTRIELGQASKQKRPGMFRKLTGAGGGKVSQLVEVQVRIVIGHSLAGFFEITVQTFAEVVEPAFCQCSCDGGSDPRQVVETDSRTVTD